MRRRQTLPRFLAVAAALPLLAACYGSAGPTGDVLDVPNALVRQGVTISSAISGDTACPSEALADNALHLKVATAADRTPHDVYLYLFRSKSFDSTGPAMDACVTEYQAAIGGLAAQRVDVAPFRALGSGWSDDLRAAIEAALRDSLDGGSGDQ